MMMQMVSPPSRGGASNHCSTAQMTERYRLSATKVQWCPISPGTTLINNNTEEEHSLNRFFATVRMIDVALCGIILVGVRGSPVSAQQTTTEALSVRAVVQDYRAAILASRGTAAVELVSASTLTYYDRMLELTLYGDSASLGRESLSDRLMVLTLRERVPPASLLGMSGRELFVYTVDVGMIGRESMQQLEFGRVRVTGDSAGIEIEQAGAPSGTFFPLVREEGDWRLDLLSMLALANDALLTVAEQQGMSEDALLLLLLEASSGRAVEPTIWHPLYDRDTPR